MKQATGGKRGAATPYEGYTPQDNAVLDSASGVLKEVEGFAATPYNDIRMNATIGYGTLLVLTRREAAVLLRMRMESGYFRLASGMMTRFGVRFAALPREVQVELVVAAYNLGASGLLGFKRMFAAIAAGDWHRAADEARDSRWHDQVPGRAERLANVLRRY